MIVHEEDINALESAWKHIVTSDAQCSIFQTWEWTSEWLIHFGREYDIKILCARHPNTSSLVAILPLMRPQTCNEWKLLGDSLEACPDHLDIIAAPDNKLSASHDFMDFIGSKTDFTICNFDHIAEWSSLKDVVCKTKLSFWNSISISRICHVVPLTGGWSEVEKNLSDKFRKRLSYYERRLRKEFDTELAEAKSEDNIKLFREMVRLHSLRWKQLGQLGAFHDEKVCRFHEGILNRLSLNEKCKIYYLAVNGKIISVVYGFLYRHVYYFYNSGFDPDYSKYSPGVVTLAFAIREAAKSGCTSFDFLRGNELYKEQWSGKHINDLSIRLYKKACGNILPMVSHEAKKIYLSVKSGLSKIIHKNVP